MQLWLRPYSQVSQRNRLCNEIALLAESGIELQVLFEKGDRLKWIDQLISEGYDTALKQNMSVANPVLNCLNEELFTRNWCSYVYGDLAGEEDSIANLFLTSLSNSLGMPLQWLIDEWETFPPPRPYHRGLFRKYQKAVAAIELQRRINNSRHFYYRDPVLANCVSLEFEYENSDFIHLNSDEVIQPAWLIMEPNSGVDQLKIA